MGILPLKSSLRFPYDDIILIFLNLGHPVDPKTSKTCCTLYATPNEEESSQSTSGATSKTHHRSKSKQSTEKPPSSSTTNVKLEKSKGYPPETLLSLAVEAAIIGLGQQRLMPPGKRNIRVSKFFTIIIFNYRIFGIDVIK